MSTQYHKGEDVPTDALADRLDELSDAITNGKEATSAEFTMRVPAEYDRDADLVLAEAARRLRAMKNELDKYVPLMAAHGFVQRPTMTQSQSGSVRSVGSYSIECHFFLNDA